MVADGLSWHLVVADGQPGVFSPAGNTRGRGCWWVLSAATYWTASGRTTTTDCWQSCTSQTSSSSLPSVSSHLTPPHPTRPASRAAGTQTERACTCLCLVVCLTLLASLFLLSHLSLKHALSHTHTHSCQSSPRVRRRSVWSSLRGRRPC